MESGQNSLLTIFIVEDDPMFGDLIQMKLEENHKYDVYKFNSGSELMSKLDLNPDVIILDYYLPEKNGVDIIRELRTQECEIEFILLSGQQHVEVVIEAYNIGVKNYIMKNGNALVELENAIKNIASGINLKNEVNSLKAQIIDRHNYGKIIGESEPIHRLLHLLQKIEHSDVLTLITGESGTGKEVVANTIHYNSRRKKNPFVAINVAAIPEDLIESELFGFEKGAFTGANGKRIGKFEEANQGTIFLDEIGEVNLNVQKKLLRVLQEKKLSRLGSNKEISLNVRIIAATNKSLGNLVKENKFREDLYYRLQGFLIHLPPLRDREHDVIILAKYFLKELSDFNKLVKTFSTDALKNLMRYEWPGNIRELKSVVERAYLISDSDRILESDLLYSESIF